MFLGTKCVMPCFLRQRNAHVPWGPCAVHSGFHCQLRSTHSSPRGAVCTAAAKAEVFPSQQVSTVLVKLLHGTDLGLVIGSCCPITSTSLYLREVEKRVWLYVKLLDVPGSVVLFTYIILNLMGTLQTKKLKHSHYISG